MAVGGRGVLVGRGVGSVVLVWEAAWRTVGVGDAKEADSGVAGLQPAENRNTKPDKISRMGFVFKIISPSLYGESI